MLPPHFTKKALGRAVAQLVEGGHYKPEGRGFDSRLCYWNFLHNLSDRLRPVRRVGLTTLPPCADCLAIWEPQTPGTLRDRDCLTFTT
jgi:hypothetical protein